MRTYRTNMETIVERVNGSMAIEGIPLSSEDKARIRRYISNPATVQVIRRGLLKKHIVRSCENH